MLLRDIAAGKMSADTLFIWDGNLARAGAKIIYQRRAYVAALEEPLSRIHTGLSGGREQIGARLQGAFDYGDLAVEELERRLLSAGKCPQRGYLPPGHHRWTPQG